MTRKLTATEVKARILGLLDDVVAGEEIEITKHGRAVARLVAATGPHALRGRFANVAMSAAAVSLPASFPGDPADRLIYATAVEHGWQLVTKDQRLRSHRHPRQVTAW